MIVPVTLPRQVDNIIPLILKIKGLTKSVEGYVAYMKAYVSNDSTLLLMDWDGQEAHSFIFMEIISNITEKEAMVNLAYFDPKNKEIGIELDIACERWANLMNCDRITIMTTPRHVKTYVKRYGFTEHFSYLRKPLGRNGAYHGRQGTLSNERRSGVSVPVLEPVS